MKDSDQTSIHVDVVNDFKIRPVKWTVIYSLKVLLWAVWVAIAVYGLWVSRGLASTLGLQILLGAAYAHGVELQHQALHQSGFKSRWANRVFGILLGLPMLVSYSAYQDNHLFHHNRLGSADDSEFFEYGDKSDRKIIAIFKHFFLINHFCEFMKNAIDATNSRTFKVRLIARNARRMRNEYRIIAIAFFGAAILCAHLDSDLFVKCWVIPLFAFAAPIHALIELPEHFDCNRNTPDVFENTRTVKTHPLVTWFTNGNNYHVEHHWMASLPVEQLRSVHRQISGQIVNLSPSYLSFYRAFFGSILFGSVPARSGARADGR